jgi:hypothetical protein
MQRRIFQLWDQVRAAFRRALVTELQSLVKQAARSRCDSLVLERIIRSHTKMNLRKPSSPFRYVSSAVALATALLLAGPAQSAPATPSPAQHAEGKVVKLKGSAESTITALVPIEEATLYIEAEQVGHLTHFGHFTGAFSYTAYLFPDEIILEGTAILTNEQGDQLFVTANFTEVGTIEPLVLSGTLTITGGTGEYADASGSIAVSGIDEESLTDTIYMEGEALTQGK